MWIVVLFAMGLAIGCVAVKSFPDKGIVDFVIDDPLLERLFLDAAQEWTDAGVVAAARITINTNPKGMKVKWSSPADIAKNCGVEGRVDLAEGEMITGCARHKGDKFYDTMWITLIASPEEIAGDEALYRRVKANIMHEQMHVVLPTPWHVPRNEPGVLNSRGGETITQADLDFISEYSEVVPPLSEAS